MTLTHGLKRQKGRHYSNFKTTPKDLGVWEVKVVHVNQTDEVLALCNTPQASLGSYAKKAVHNMTAASTTRANSISTTRHQQNHPNSPSLSSSMEVPST